MRLAVIGLFALATAAQAQGPAAPPPADPRVGLRAGWMDAAEAIWNLRVVSKTPPSSGFTNPATPGDNRFTNSDLAFSGTRVIQGNYSGWQIWDIANPAHPSLAVSFL